MRGGGGLGGGGGGGAIGLGGDGCAIDLGGTGELLDSTGPSRSNSSYQILQYCKPQIARRLLKLPHNASNYQIKRARKREMIAHHPDRHENSEAKVKYCKALNKAKYTLFNSFEEISTTTKQKNIYYHFESAEEEYLFWERVIRGLNEEW